MIPAVVWVLSTIGGDIGGDIKLIESAVEKMQEWAKLYLRFDVAKMKIVWVTATIVSTGMRRSLIVLITYYIWISNCKQNSTLQHFNYFTLSDPPPTVPSTVELVFPEPMQTLIYVYSFLEVGYCALALRRITTTTVAVRTSQFGPSSHRSTSGAAWVRTVTRMGSTT